MKCHICTSKCQKAGKQSTGVQKYLCTSCKKYQQVDYRYKACQQSEKRLFLKCLKVGNSLSGIRVITGIAISTQLRWIRKLGNEVKPRNTLRSNDVYELDELCTYVQNKQKRRWVISAISRTTGQIVAIKVGTRTKYNLALVVNKLLQLSPRAIYTDRLSAYRNLIPKHLHRIKFRGINKIERFHLTLRTHIKRLNRKTICFSKKEDLLEGIIRIYAWE